MTTGPQAAPTAAPRPPSADAEEAGPEPFDVEALARGERAAIDLVYRELFEPVYAFVFWRVGGDRQDAEDVTQETFVTALSRLGSFERRSGLHTWICGIARNLARDRVRLRARDRAGTDAGAGEAAGEPGPMAVGDAVAPDALYERAETERLVGLALSELPPRYQRALLDKYVRRQSFAEMATAQSASAKAVESTVQRAKQALSAGLARLGLARARRGAQDGSHEGSHD